MKTLGIILTVALGHLALGTTCLGDTHLAASDLEHGISSRIEGLLNSPSHRHYRAALKKIKDEHAQMEERTSVFGNDQYLAMEQMNQRFGDVLSEMEQNRLAPDRVDARLARVYRETAAEMGTVAFNLEDHEGTVYGWRRMFERKGIKLAQTDKPELAEFWLEHMNRNTYLFFDGDLHGKFAGPALTAKARELKYPNVYMVSGNTEDELKAGGKPADVRNLTKPTSITEVLSIIGGQ